MVLNLLSKGDKHQAVGGDPTYAYPKAVAYFFLAFSVVPLLMVWLIRDPHTIIEVPMAVSAIAILLFVWALRYRVILDKDAISCGSFFIRRFRYSDVTHVKRYDVQFMIYASSSRWPMTLFYQIADFSTLLKEIEARLPEHVKVKRLGRLTK